jgi:hypothetical protein
MYSKRKQSLGNLNSTTDQVSKADRGGSCSKERKEAKRQEEEEGGEMEGENRMIT